MMNDGRLNDGKNAGAPRQLRSAPPWPFVLLLTLLPMANTSAAHAGRFEIDQRRTEVRFAYKMALSTQRGRFTKVSGTIEYNPAAPEKSKVSASIATASLSTGEAYVDNELKGPAFFNAEASPVISFKSIGVKPRATSAAALTGEITINGITKSVILEVSLAPHDDPALKFDTGAHKFVAKARIKRSAFNMTKFQALVDDDVDLEIDAIVRPR